MFQLIVTACLAVSSQICAPILLPAGQARSQADCLAAAERISSDWYRARPELVAAGVDCLDPGDLPALALRQLDEGVYVHLGQPVQLEGSSDGWIANLGVVIGETVAVIDSGASRAQGQQFYAAIRRLTDKPISHVILTHGHPDHMLGTQVFAEAGAQIVGHHGLPTALQIRGQNYLENMIRLYGDRLMLGTEIAAPGLLVKDRMIVDLGGRRLTVTAVGTAHTDSDLSVTDDLSGVLFSGDLIFRELTPVVDGSLTGWLEWQSTAPEPEPRLIVPGHGEIATSWEEAVTAQAEFLNALTATTRRQIDEGVPMSVAVPRIVEEMTPLSPGWAAYPDTVARNATAAYKELEWQ